MNKFIPGSRFLVLPVLFLFLNSCTPQSCFEQTEAFVNATLYSNKTGKLLAPDSLTVYGLNMGTNRLYNQTKSVTKATLPLNASTSHCTYIIKINGITDTLEFRYTSFPYLISKECGYTFYHSLNTDSLVYSKNMIDSVYVRNKNISTFNDENIRIFY
jgi:hypothetical protein